MTKKNFFIAVILVFLIGIAYFYQDALKEWRDNIGEPRNFLSRVDFDDVSKIRITKRK